MSIASGIGWFAETSDGNFHPIACWVFDDGEITGAIAMGNMLVKLDEVDDFVGYVHEDELIEDPESGDFDIEDLHSDLV